MGRIVGANGLPADHRPAVLRPGQEQAAISVGLGPAGVVLAVTIGGRAWPIPMPPGAAAQLGTALIGLDAISQFRREGGGPIAPDAPASQGALPGPAEDLLEESIRTVTAGD